MNNNPRTTNDNEYTEETSEINRSQQAQSIPVSSVTDHVTENERLVTGNERLVVPLSEEYLEVNKQWVQSGEVRLRKSVQSSTQSIPVQVEYEEVQIDRVPVNRALAKGEKSEPWWDGDVMVVPVVEEEIVVTKRQVVREEIRISKRRMSRQETVSDTVRSEQISVEAMGDLEPVSDANNEEPRGSRGR